ncbi:MAG: TatD family hydrolase [Deltaproteobacteria bacterium]
MIDTHAHLNEIEDIHRAILRAKEAGLKGIVAVGMDLLSNQRTLYLASKFPEMVHPAIGYHPWSINQETKEQNLKFIEKNLANCIALGEVGIDYKTKVVQWPLGDSEQNR